MRIIALSSQDPDDVSNGIGMIAHNSMRCFVDAGHTVEAVCIVDDRNAEMQAYAQIRSSRLRDLTVFRISRRIEPLTDALRALTGCLLSAEEKQFSNEARRRSRGCDLAVWFGHLWDPLTRELLINCECPVVLHVNDSATLARQQRPGGVLARIQTVAAQLQEFSAIRRLAVGRAAAVYVAEADRQSALKLAGPENAECVLCLPLAVDTDVFVPNDAARADTGPPVILLTGNMGFRPNVMAATRLVNGILPLLPRELTVRLAGKSPAQAVSGLAAVDARVHVTGEVHDIVGEYQNADVFVAPLPYSYGMKSKVLEAMSCGLPVVASPGAASGFDGIPSGILVGTTDEEMARLVRELLADEGLRRRTGDAGRQHVIRHHSWADRTRKLLGLMNSPAGNDRNSVSSLNKRDEVPDCRDAQDRAYVRTRPEQPAR